MYFLSVVSRSLTMTCYCLSTDCFFSVVTSCIWLMRVSLIKEILTYLKYDKFLNIKYLVTYYCVNVTMYDLGILLIVSVSRADRALLLHACLTVTLCYSVIYTGTKMCKTNKGKKSHKFAVFWLFFFCMMKKINV